MIAATHRTAETLRALGHDVFEMGLGIDYRQLYRAQGLVSASNFAASMMRWVAELGREPEPGELGPLAQRAYDAGRRVSGQQALWGWQQLRLFNIQILERFQLFDVYLTPTMSRTSPRIDELDPLVGDLKDFDRNQASTYGTTPPFNFTGQPSLSLPLWQSDENMPISMMFTGQFGDEATLYRLAANWRRNCRGRAGSRRCGADGIASLRPSRRSLEARSSG